MSDFVLEAMEARLNAILGEIRASGFGVLDADNGSIETLKLERVSRLALPGPGAESQTPADPPAGGTAREKACSVCGGRLRSDSAGTIHKRCQARQEKPARGAGKA